MDNEPPACPLPRPNGPRASIVSRTGKRGFPWIPVFLGAALAMTVLSYWGYQRWKVAHRRTRELTPEELRQMKAGTHNFRCMYFLGKNDPVTAAKEATLAVEICPEWGLAHINLARALSQNGDWPNAGIAANRALELSTGSSYWSTEEEFDAHSIRGTDRANRLDAAGALSDFERAYSVDPKASWMIGQIALTKAKLGRMDEATSDVEKWLKLDSNQSMAWFLRGVLELWQGKNAEAISDLDKALQLAPDNAQIRALRGIARLNSGQGDAAEQDFVQALDQDPNCWAANLGLGKTSRTHGDLGKALRHLEAAMETLEGRSSCDVWFERGLARMDGRNVVGAAEDLRKSLALAPPWWPHRMEAERALGEAEAPEK